jgi:hypothetical protein
LIEGLPAFPVAHHQPHPVLQPPQQQQQPTQLQQPLATAVPPPPPAANSNSIASTSSGSDLAEQQQHVQQSDPNQQQQQQQQAAAAPPWPPDIPWGLGKVVQVMGLWLLAYLALGQLVVPALLALLGVDQAALGPRGSALLNLSLDLGQVGITLAMLAGCLGRYAPRQRGLFRLAWQGGRWLWIVAAGEGAVLVLLMLLVVWMTLSAAAVAWLVVVQLLALITNNYGSSSWQYMYRGMASCKHLHAEASSTGISSARWHHCSASLLLLLLSAPTAGALAFPVVDWLANSSMVMLSGEAPGSVELWPTQVRGRGGRRSRHAIAATPLLWQFCCIRDCMRASLSSHCEMCSVCRLCAASPLWTWLICVAATVSRATAKQPTVLLEPVRPVYMQRLLLTKAAVKQAFRCCASADAVLDCLVVTWQRGATCLGCCFPHTPLTPLYPAHGALPIPPARPG